MAYLFLQPAIDFAKGNPVTLSLRDFETMFDGAAYHLWYIFAICSMYILLPIIQKICESRQILEYYLVIWFVTNALLPVIRNHCPLLDGVFAFAALDIVCGYSGLFILGYYLDTYYDENALLNRRSTRVMAGAIALGAVALGYGMSLRMNANLQYTQPTTVCAVFYSSLLFILFKRKFNGEKVPVVTVITLVICFVVNWVIRKIPVAGKWIV